MNRSIYFSAFLCALVLGEISAQEKLFEVYGDNKRDHLGFSVAGAGDVNGDGVPDLISGAFRNDHGGTHNWWDSGQAKVISGADGSIIWEFHGEDELDQFGLNVDGAGDVNADGFCDVIVGSRYDDNQGEASGSATVFSGRDGSILYQFNGDQEGDWLGFDVGGVGDVNNDGYDDVAAGAPRVSPGGRTWSGMVRVYSGYNGEVLHEFFGTRQGYEMGKAVDCAGDANGDGYDDIAVSSPAASFGSTFQAGYIQVFSGLDGSLLWDARGDEQRARYARSAHTAGDVDGDGLDDLVVAAYWYDTWGFEDAGLIHVLSGADGSLIYSFFGDSEGDWAGWSVSGGGDFDGDQVPDLLVGIVYDDNHGEWSGSARVYSGADHSILWTWNGEKEFDYFGASVDFIGDTDQDGRDEVVVGAYRADHQGFESGSVYVFRGGDRPKIGTGVTVAGSQAEFSVRNCEPNSMVSFYASERGFGAAIVDGVYLDLNRPQLMGTAQADASGYAQLTQFLPGRLSERMIFFQGIEQGNGAPRATTANCVIVE